MKLFNLNIMKWLKGTPRPIIKQGKLNAKDFKICQEGRYGEIISEMHEVTK